MEQIKSIFVTGENTPLELLHDTCSKLRARKYTFKYHIEGDKAVVLVSHNNPHKLQNGLIFTYPDFQLLATTYRIFYNIPANLKDAKYYSIRDGTTVYLYFFEGEWRMASNKSVNIGNSNFRGYTFWELILECDPQLLEKLDTNKSYYLGFTNSKIHHTSTGNHIWNNNFEETIPIPHLPELPELDLNQEYGTLISFPGIPIRYIKHSKLCTDLKNLKYSKKINRDIVYFGYDYDNYIMLYAWLKSTLSFQKLKKIENRDEEFDDFNSRAEMVCNEMKKKYNKFGELRCLNNIDMFYQVLFKS